MWKILVALSCIFSIAAAECFKDSSEKVKYYRDCKEALEKGIVCSGVYTIKPDDLPPFEVYCDMDSDGGGWVVFQRRMDGTVDFYRRWADYLKGFGDLNGEFWLGLYKIHRLTQAASTTLRVDLGDFEGGKRYANYTTFRVRDSSRNYTLIIGGYSGDAGDSLAYHNGMNFTTLDEDNDTYEGSHYPHKDNCAIAFKGAWWYRSCHGSNLNGRYLSGYHTSYADGINWSTWKGYYYSFKTTEMKVR